MKNKFVLALAFFAHSTIAAPVDNPVIYHNALQFQGAFIVDGQM